ncbi:MAG: hypothetical protein NXI31_13750 [bacterium]|nr:hypothetical protein [bacterium]
MSDERTAYHEAGHVFLADLLGGEVLESTLESEDAEQEGRTAIAWRGLTAREQTYRSALTALAGPIAETIWLGQDALSTDPSSWRGDWQEVTVALDELAPGEARTPTLHEWITIAARELEDPRSWECVCRIADALAAHETLDRDLLDGVLGSD